MIDEEKDVPLPEKVAEDLKKQIEREKNSGGMLVETEATSSGRGILLLLIIIMQYLKTHQGYYLKFCSDGRLM